MRLGVVFPQTEIGNDPAVIRDFAQAVEGMGYNHLLTYEHVLGADVSARPGWRGPYTRRDAFHEPFVLLGYLAAVTSRLELVTGIVILPQRQTVLAAKQAAEVDLLSGERLRLGVGIGWNAVEFEALGMNYGDRGVRCEEQIAVMRQLWAQDVVTVHGRWHTVEAAGINPRPRRQIPIWFGGSDDRALRRMARLGEGWLPLVKPDAAGLPLLERLRDYVHEAGRDPASFGVEARVTVAGTNGEEQATQVEAWRSAGATHVSVNTMRAGFASAEQHLTELRRFMERHGGTENV